MARGDHADHRGADGGAEDGLPREPGRRHRRDLRGPRGAECAAEPGGAGPGDRGAALEGAGAGRDGYSGGAEHVDAGMSLLLRHWRLLCFLNEDSGSVDEITVEVRADADGSLKIR